MGETTLLTGTQTNPILKRKAVERAILILLSTLALVRLYAPAIVWAQSSTSSPLGSSPSSTAAIGTPIISKSSDSVWLFAPAHYTQAVAYGPDGAIYYTEFAKHRLMKLSSKGVESVLINQPGLYGVAVDSANRIYVGLDLGDEPDASGKFVGSVNRVEYDKGGKAFLLPLITNIRRPRNLVVYGHRLYLILEAERVIISINPDKITKTGMPAVRREFKLPIKDSANGLAINKGNFYWAQYGEYEDRNKIVGGTIRSTSMKNPGEIKTIASGLGRARGVAFDANDNLYFTTESNAKDQGNSGVLGKISPNGTITTLIDDLDYPQFLAVYLDGTVIIPFCRENFIAMLQPKAPSKKLNSPYPGIEIFGTGLISGTSDADNSTLTLSFTELGRTLKFRVKVDNSSLVHGGWITVPFSSLNLSQRELAQYRTELLYPMQPEVPTPGFFKKPRVTCSIGGKNCAASVLSRRSHVKWRWPMTGPAGAEQPPAGFSETPHAFLVNFYW